MTPRRAAGWLIVVALLELVTRAIVYALAPAPVSRARSLSGEVGGPRFAIVLVVAVGIGVLLAAGIVWLASLGVAERWDLAADRPRGPRPRIRLRRLLARAAALTLAGWLAFASVESVIHLRAGLGFHGLDCLVGPVHRNAMPVVAALAIVVAALSCAAELLVAWMRRTVARFGAPRPVFVSWTRPALIGAGRVVSALLAGAASARGPPAFVAV
jgi:hypothetical protein